MNPLPAGPGRLLLVGVALAIVGAEPAARAQDDAVEAKAQFRLKNLKSTLDSWFATRYGLKVERQEFLEALLHARLKHLTSDRQLTKDQITKLRVAGLADIKRFDERLDQIARNLQSAESDPVKTRIATGEFQKATESVDAGFFVNDSLFFKVLTGVLKQVRVGGQTKVSGDTTNANERLRTEAVLARSELSQLLMRSMGKEDFDRWIERELKSGVERRNRLEVRLANRLNELVGDCILSAAQFKKLQLAGEDDINRFLEKIDQFVERFTDPLVVLHEFPVREAESVRLLCLTDFGDDSSFAKALATTLSPDQVARHDRRRVERNFGRYRRAIHQAAESLAKMVRMTDDQRTAFEKLLQRETRPPRQFGRFSLSDDKASPNADLDIALFEAAKIPDQILKANLGEALANKLERRLAQRREKDHEQWLSRHGFVSGADAAAVGPTRSESGAKNL
jgi:chemotaxis protein histidine kinase CheA